VFLFLLGLLTYCHSEGAVRLKNLFDAVIAVKILRFAQDDSIFNKSTAPFY